MWWKVTILLGVGLMYFGYVRANTDQAMNSLETLKTSYAQVIDRAGQGTILSPAAQLTGY